ncbi:hypothetical protein G9A89_004408 [Geosiphon pyriformis]|nr:hypothetical protein G9A89_004408 [Geosiphon pyriformis]
MGKFNSADKKRREKRKIKKPQTLQPLKLIDGRLFNNVDNSVYYLPSDDEESDRQQLQHFLFWFLWQGLFGPPIERELKQGIRVLDVGCGPSGWVLEMATTYTESEFIGIDYIHIFPSEIKPSNTFFIQSNVLNGLPFEALYKHLETLGIDSNFASEKCENLLRATKKLTEITHKITKLSHNDRVGRAGEISKDNAILYYRTIAPIVM